MVSGYSGPDCPGDTVGDTESRRKVIFSDATPCHAAGTLPFKAPVTTVAAGDIPLTGIGSTEFLRLIARNGLYIALERAVPRGPLKRDRATLHYQDGREVVLQRDSYISRPELPIETLNDYLQASFVREHATDDQGRTIFQLTDDGLRVGSGSALESGHTLYREEA